MVAAGERRKAPQRALPTDGRPPGGGFTEPAVAVTGIMQG